eukprot:s21_g9.t1
MHGMFGIILNLHITSSHPRRTDSQLRRFATRAGARSSAPASVVKQTAPCSGAKDVIPKGHDMMRDPYPLRGADLSQWATPELNCELQIAVVPDLICQLQISVGNAGPQLRAPDGSPVAAWSWRCSRSQWATPDLNRELQIPVGNAGSQPRAPDPSGHCRTSTAR